MTENTSSAAQSQSDHEELAITLWHPDKSSFAETDASNSDTHAPDENFSFGSRLTLGQRAVLSAYGVFVCGVGMFASFAAGMTRIGLILAIMFVGYVGLAFITWREYREQKRD